MSYDAFFKDVDARAESYIARLAEAVAIPSVSAEPDRRPRVFDMVALYQRWAERLGARTETRDPGMQRLDDGREIPLPPVLFVTFGADPRKRTVCVYGHLDVQVCVPCGFHWARENRHGTTAGTRAARRAGGRLAHGPFRARRG